MYKLLRQTFNQHLRVFLSLSQENVWSDSVKSHLHENGHQAEIKNRALFYSLRDTQPGILKKRAFPLT